MILLILLSLSSPRRRPSALPLWYILTAIRREREREVTVYLYLSKQRFLIGRRKSEKKCVSGKSVARLRSRTRHTDVATARRNNM